MICVSVFYQSIDQLTKNNKFMLIGSVNFISTTPNKLHIYIYCLKGEGRGGEGSGGGGMSREKRGDSSTSSRINQIN